MVDPRFFQKLAEELGDATLVRAELKAGRARNEMTRFRYDVVLRKRGGTLVEGRDRAAACPRRSLATLDALRALLADEPASLCVLGVPNARLRAE